MAVIVYKSTDAGAPVLTGQVGSLLAVLDAILVGTGGVAYGAKASAGWTKPFANVGNVGCYKGGSGVLPQITINDNAANVTSGAREAQCRGAENLTSVSATVGPYPTVAQLASGIIIRKSSSADATATPWVCVADDKTFHFWPDTKDNTGYTGFSFGEFFSLKTGDLFRSIIMGKITAGAIQPSDADDNLAVLSSQTAGAPGVIAGHYVPRNPFGDIQSAQQVAKHSDAIKGANELLATGTRMGNGQVAYPNPQDGNGMAAKIWIHDPLGAQMNVRGRVRGLWDWLHPMSAVPDGFTFAGAGDLAGRNFMVVAPSARGDGLYLVETSNTWDTSV